MGRVMVLSSSCVGGAVAGIHCSTGTGRGAGAVPPRRDNPAMTVFYWVMAVLIVGTFVPSLLYLLLYAVTGEDGCMRRAKILWNYTRVFTLLAVNLLIWGHVAAGLWQIVFN
jgi:hypothetical protein